MLQKELAKRLRARYDTKMDGNSKLLGVGNVGGISGVVISLCVNDKAVFVSFAHEQQARDIFIESLVEVRTAYLPHGG